MVTTPEFDLELYEQRLREWDRLLEGAQSSTLKGLFEAARSGTEAALKQFVQLQHMTAVILAAANITFEKSMEQYTLFLKEITQNIQLDRAANTPMPGRAEYYDSLTKKVYDQATKEKKVHDLSLEVYPLAIAKFQAVLLLIYQPRNGVFHYESIVDACAAIAEKFIPGLSEFKGIRKWIPSIRKKEFAGTSDKFMLYVEQYLDALAKWGSLTDAYIELLNS